MATLIERVEATASQGLVDRDTWEALPYLLKAARTLIELQRDYLNVPGDLHRYDRERGGLHEFPCRGCQANEMAKAVLAPLLGVAAEEGA